MLLMDCQFLIGENSSLEVTQKSGLVLSESEQKAVTGFFHSFSSKLTSKEYVSASGEFLKFVSRDIDRLGELRRDHLILYQKWLQERGRAEKTILKKISAISSFLKHLAHEGMVEKDLSYGLKRPKSHNKRETADFTDEEVKRIFAALNPKRQTFYAHRAILAVGFYTGLRSREIIGLKIKNVAEVKGHRVLNLKIKGNKPHEVPLNPFAWMCISEHIEKLKDWGFDTESPEQWLFPRLKPMENKPITQQGLTQILKSRMKDAGIKKSLVRRYSPHSMRATLAGHLLNTIQAPLEQVQRTLGHSSPTTTMRYNKRELEHHKSPVYKIDY